MNQAGVDMHTPPSQTVAAIEHMTIIGTGDMNVCSLPSWILALRSWYPKLQIDTVLTYSACNLVAPGAIRATSGRSPVLPSESGLDGPIHRHLGADSELVLITPMTLAFMSKWSLLITDSNALFVATLAQTPTFATAAVPESVWNTSIAQFHSRTLRSRGVHLMGPSRGVAAFSGQQEKSAPPSLFDILAFIDERTAPGRTQK